MSPKQKILLATAVGLLVIVAAVFLMFAHRNSPSYSQKVTSKDTGETLSIEVNKTPEKQSGGGQVAVFGAYLILDNGATQQQYQAIKEAISTYSSARLKNQYSYLTILPNSFRAENTDMYGQLRLGDTSRINNIHIRIWKLKYVELFVSDPSARTRDFDSGPLTVSEF